MCVLMSVDVHLFYNLLCTEFELFKLYLGVLAVLSAITYDQAFPANAICHSKPPGVNQTSNDGNLSRECSQCHIYHCSNGRRRICTGIRPMVWHYLAVVL